MSVSPNLLSDVPERVCDAVRLVLPDLRSCRPHAGRFDLNELKQSGLAAPAVLVSVLGAKQGSGHAGGAVVFTLRLAAFVVTRDGLGLPRDVAAGAICQALMDLLPERNWGEPALGAARDVEASTLVSSAARDVAASLWAVTWSHPVTLFHHAPGPLGAELYVAQTPPEGEAVAYEEIGGQP